MPRNVLLTRGEEGMSLFQSDGTVTHLPTTAGVGAGCLGGGRHRHLHAHDGARCGGGITESCILANCAGGVVVGAVGIVPILPEQLLGAALRQHGHARGRKLMEKIVSLPALARIRARLRRQGKRVVFTNGTFDIVHRGHVEYLSAARRMGDVLIVGLNSDSSIRRIKGPKRPINRGADRAAVLAALASVDYVCSFGEDTPYRMIRRLLPDVLVKGADWKKAAIVGSDVVKENGGRSGPSVSRRGARRRTSSSVSCGRTPAAGNEGRALRRGVRFVRKIRTIALYLLIGIPLLVGVVIAITQTQIFRDRLRAAALSELDSLVNGEVHIGRLDGDLITGISIDSISIDVDNGPFLRIPRLEVAYNFFALPGKTIAIRKLTLTHPEVSFLPAARRPVEPVGSPPPSSPGHHRVEALRLGDRRPAARDTRRHRVAPRLPVACR
jgi:rfaE bifunctional protein nucleotidyltransferase chain/domain